MAVERARFGIRGCRGQILSRVPLRRRGRTDEWAGVAVYLAGAASSWHTGVSLRLDGGYGVF